MIDVDIAYPGLSLSSNHSSNLSRASNHGEHRHDGASLSMRQGYILNNAAAEPSSISMNDSRVVPGNVILKAHTQKVPRGAADKFRSHHR